MLGVPGCVRGLLAGGQGQSLVVVFLPQAWVSQKQAVGVHSVSQIWEPEVFPQKQLSSLSSAASHACLTREAASVLHACRPLRCPPASAEQVRLDCASAACLSAGGSEVFPGLPCPRINLRDLFLFLLFTLELCDGKEVAEMCLKSL